jgi:hypothetical protein
MSSSIKSAVNQLYNVGHMDNYLSGHSGNPDTASIFTYNIESISQYSKNVVPIQFTEVVDFGNTITLKLPFSGDLINKIVLHLTLPPLTIPENSTFVGWNNCVGYSIINSIEVLISQISVVHHTGEFMELYDYISTDASSINAKYSCVGRYDNVNILRLDALTQQELYIPLQYWFNKNISASLPMLSLSGTDVSLRIKFNDFQNCVVYDGDIPPTNVSIVDARILADYYYITEEEKIDFKSQQLTYLFEQIQVQSQLVNEGTTYEKFTVNFDKSVKEIIVVARDIASEHNNDLFNYGSRNPDILGLNFLSSIQMYLNGAPRFEKQDESYWRLVAPLNYHTFSGNRNIYVIPFAEKPESNQATGTINFSNYDSIEIACWFLSGIPQLRLTFYAVSYNVLNISNGIANVQFLS